jgi:hypothetical protein
MPTPRRSVFCLLNRAASLGEKKNYFSSRISTVNSIYICATWNVIFFIRFLNTQTVLKFVTKGSPKKFKDSLSGVVNLGPREGFSHL